MIRTLATVLLALNLAATATAAQATTAKPTTAKATAITIGAPINLNTATAEQLATIPGVGPRMAERIIDYRQKSGAFKKVEDLMNVSGIGEKNFLKMRPLVTVTPPTSAGKQLAAQPGQ